MKKSTFQWGPFLKTVIVIAVPVALQNLLTNTGSIVDEMMIAPLGEQTVGAVGLCVQFSTLVFSCYWGFIAGGMMFMSQYFGANDEAGVERSYGLMTALCMGVALIATVLSTLFPEAVMKLYTDKEALQEIGKEYVRIMGFSFPFTVYSTCMAALLRATGHAKIPTISSLLSVITNVLLNYILINGRFGFPALGVKGAAVATVAAGIVNMLSSLILSKAYKNIYIFRFRGHFRWPKDFVPYFFKKTYPILFNEILIGVSGSVISLIFGRQSEAAIAAYAVISILEGVYIAFFTGYANASGILIGNAVGAGKLREAYDEAPKFVLLCTMIIAIIDIPLLLFETQFLSALGLSGESLAIGKNMVKVFAVVFIIRMDNWLINDTFRAGGDSAFGTICELSFMYILVLPLLAVSAFVWQLPFIALFAIRYCDEFVRIIMMLVHMRNGKWMKPVTPEGIAAIPAFLSSLEKK